MVRAALPFFPHLKVIYISGYAEDSFRAEVHNNAAMRFLPKPFSLKALAARVKDVLGEAELAPLSTSARSLPQALLLEEDLVA